MNLAYIIDKTQYLKINVESIEIERQGIEFGHVGSPHTFMVYGGPPIAKLSVTVDNIDLKRFYSEVNLQKKVICECRTTSMFDLANRETHLIEFIPIEITYTPDGERHDRSKLNITCYDLKLIVLGESQ